MTQSDFNAAADALATRIGVRETLHGYFRSHRTRLYQTCQRFSLFERDLGHVLDIGPFYSYTPLLLRDRAKSYDVLEGDDPAAEPLTRIYAEHDVNLKWVDLLELFGPGRNATRELPYAAESFDTILCWETMEHFSFNPVPFVRELWRIMRPGGRLYMTVPNRASGEALFALLTNRNQRYGIDAYYQFENYECNGKRVFLGFHWREYTLAEFSHLFSKAGFRIAEKGWSMHFQDSERLSFGREMARFLLRSLCLPRPSLGKNCYLVAEKPVQSGSSAQANNS